MLQLASIIEVDGAGNTATGNTATGNTATGNTDTEYQGAGYDLVGTYPWGGGDVVVTGAINPDYCCPPLEVELIGVELNGGSQGVACRDWQVSTFDDGGRGFYLIAVRGAGSAVLEVDGERSPIDLGSSNVDDLRVAVVDIPASITDPEARAQARPITVLDASGAPLPCVQE